MICRLVIPLAFRTVFSHSLIISSQNKYKKRQMEEVQEMNAVCCSKGEGGKKVKNFLGALIQKMKEGEQKAVTVYFCSSDSVKDSALQEPFLVSCLLYLLLRYRLLHLKLVPSAKTAPKIKKPDILIRVQVAQDFSLSRHALQKLGGMLLKSYQEQGQMALHLEQISLECLGDAAEGECKELLKKREQAFNFADHFYQSLNLLFQGRKLFILKNYLNISCRKQSFGNVNGGDLHLIAEEAWTKKILKQQQEIFSNTLIIKVRSPQIFAAFNPNANREENEKEEEKINEKLGFFSGFSGNPSQYLSNIVLQFAIPCSLNYLQGVFPKLPNLSQMRLTKSFEEMTVPNVQGVLQALAKNCKLVQTFWLSNIRVQIISVQILRDLYEECPFLFELEMTLPLEYLQDSDSAEGTCWRLLDAMRLRKVSIMHNMDMAKLLIAKGYRFNEAIEIIDCIEPFNL